MTTNVDVWERIPVGTREDPRPKFVAIGGSLRVDSYTYRALQVAVERVMAWGGEVEIWDLRALQLPFCDGSKEYAEYPDVQRLRNAVRAADGLILATPEYHGSLSGSLKNALDLMGFEEFEGKVAGAISVLGGENNSNALNDLRLILRWVHAWVIPEQVAVGKAWQAFDANGQIKDERLAQRFDDFARSLVKHTCKLRGLLVPSQV